MRIGIFGGTFDPVHRGHLEVAQKARAQFSLDKVIFVPACQPPHKQKIPVLTPAQDRFEMVRRALEDESGLEISDCELQRGGLSYTIETILGFEKEYPGAELFLILGRDALDGIDTWHRADELKKKVRFLVARRETDKTPEVQGARVDWVGMPLCPVSASGIRDAIKQGKSSGDQLLPKVQRYIREHNLYREN
jgi:nicotinate-nucleotide adenylyltransferase